MCLLLATALMARSSLWAVIRGLFVTKGVCCVCVCVCVCMCMYVCGCVCVCLCVCDVHTKQTGCLALITLILVSNGSTEPSTWLVVAYFCTGRVVTECICRLFPLVTSELADEDRALHTRSQSMAASIVGMSALVAKPGLFSCLPCFCHCVVFCL